MSLLSDWKNIYFVGIGGIGMSALARWFNANGFFVAGYDKTATPLIESLTDENIAVNLQDDIEHIPLNIRENLEETLVVYTPAIPIEHQQMNYFRDQNCLILKRSQVLGILTKNLTTIGVAGTHGKTTTSSMVAHLLKVAELNVAAFLGGITQNYHTNLLLNTSTEKLEDVLCVVEADEYDRSFLTLFPKIGLVTSTDADHLDIYGQHESVLESFREYVGQIGEDGVLFMRDGLSLASSAKGKVLRYGLESGDYFTQNVRIENARFVFDLVHPDGIIHNITMRVSGYHNIENAVGASAIALYLGVDGSTIKAGLESYLGVKRRFEYHVETESHVYIDDYAHHPAEIKAFLSSVKALYPDKHLTAIFQPHLYTRTRDFADEFAESLSVVDRLWLMDIYPARELPIKGVNSEFLLEKIHIVDKKIVSIQDIFVFLSECNTEVVVTIGAGDIDKLVLPIKNIL
jgi:UDP-N-acetylmuramate--alanine ligase